MRAGITLLELPIALFIVAQLGSLLLARYRDLQTGAQEAQYRQLPLNLRSTYAIYPAQTRNPPNRNAFKALMGNPTPLRLSSSCPSGTTVAYWDHNGNALCNAGERLAYLYADEACQTFLIAVSATTVTVPIRCLRGHPDTLD